MKKLYFLLVGICFFGGVNAQIINFPDANFKAKLLAINTGNNDAKDLYGNSIKIDSNNNGEIEVNEALQVYSLNLYLSNISDLTGIEYFANLKYFYVSNNNLTNLDLTKLANLTQLYCDNNSLTNLNVQGLKNLEILYCNDNKLTDLNLSNLKGLVVVGCYYNNLVSLNVLGSDNIQDLLCHNNELASLDLSFMKNLRLLVCNDNILEQINFIGCTSLSSIHCDNNNLINLDLSDLNQIYLSCNNNSLESLILKNGRGVNDLFLAKNPNLKYICVNEADIDKVQQILNFQGITNCLLNSYCSFTPGGTFYTIRGNSKLDTNINGYDSNDDNCSNLNFSITDGTNKGNIISNASGNYSIPVQEGTHIITPVLENPTYFTVSPPSISVAFPTQTSPFIQNFCITPNGFHQDVEVTILPTIPARPGFDATYKIVYKNKGNQTQSGSVSLTFNDAVLDFVSANPAISNQVTDKLSWDYTNLQPLETREITVTLNVNSPMEIPAVNIGDRLSFNALINPVTGDEKPVDNSSALRQSVVGSIDPNDKTCLEGDIITPDLIGEYVNYMIRFENTGNYPAQNIVVKDLIDLTKFDISTLIPTKASHEFVTKISDGNKVEFIFENINLPFDNATNDGYIAFKIKTLPTLVVGDSFTNEANIFFDYNFPVLTNKATTTFKTLGTPDFEFSNYFNVYPNPANEVLNIAIKSVIDVKSINVYNTLGQIVIAIPDAQAVSKVDVSRLTAGNYFIKMNTDKGTSSMKFIKN